MSFAYNALGQRVKKGPNPAATTSATMYFYDFEGNLLGEIDSTGAIVREYIYRGNSRVGFIEGGNLYYFHNDTTGNPVLVTGANRQVVWEAIYEPFGLAFVNSASTIENNFRFQGQYYDKETGLHYNFHRYYDPGAGRYITPDPIGLAGGINLYGYAGNDPVNLVDPFGLDATNWNNTTGGRSRWDGPTNGNWGGQCWSGGQYSCGGNPMGNAPATDSGDACYERHDKCWDACGPGNPQCMAACDLQLVGELRNLPDDPRNWPQPPRPGTAGDSRRYRDWAIRYFR